MELAVKVSDNSNLGISLYDYRRTYERLSTCIGHNARNVDALLGLLGKSTDDGHHEHHDC